MNFVSIALFFVASIGVVVVALRGLVAIRFLKKKVPAPAVGPLPPLSILKPLCGVDDGLRENLLSFAALDYPDYEVLLGFKSPDDAARPIADEMVARFPSRFRIVMQEGEPGFNPKVNQLITLSAAAKNDILVVSDASVRVEPDYLAALAPRFADPKVGLVVNPVVGIGERTLGSLFDNVYFTAHFATGAIAANIAGDKDFVNGKSMAMRRSDLVQFGGFESVKNHLAEDDVLARRFAGVLGKRAAFVPHLSFTLSQRRTISSFVARYTRWSVLQRRAVGLGVYTLQWMIYPTFVAAMALACWPSLDTLAGFAVIAWTKALVDVLTVRAMRPAHPLPLAAALVMPISDLLIGWAWLRGLVQRRVEWRGNVLRVTHETLLVPLNATDDEDDPRPISTLNAAHR